MIIQVKTKTSCSKQRIELITDSNYQIFLKSQPINNQANLELVNLLAKYFKVLPSNIKIIRGLHFKRKSILIKDVE